MSTYDLIPGTALPVDSAEPGVANVRPHAVSLFEKLSSRDDISPSELHIVGAALRAYDRAPKKIDTKYLKSSGVTDATTGNIVLELFEVPAGWQAQLTQVTVDAPGTALTPAAPLANAASYMFVALGGGRTQRTTNPTTLRGAAVAFAPDTAAGPIIPGQWTFNDSSAPIGRGGQVFLLCLVGGSISPLPGATVSALVRVNLEQFGE